MKAKVITAIVLAAVCAAGITVFALMKNAPVSDPVAEIRLNGEVIRRAPLSEDAEFTIDCGTGSNTITISGGAVRVSAADCPDKVCVHTGAVSHGKIPIICLPHRLEILIVSADDLPDTAAY